MSHVAKYDALAGELYDLTKVDWHVSASTVITEPVCWTVTLTPEDPSDAGLLLPELRGFSGTADILETLSLAIDHLIGLIKANASDV